MEADEAFVKSRNGGGVDKKADPDRWENNKRYFQKQGQKCEKESRVLMAAAQQEVLKSAEVIHVHIPWSNICRS